jgi:hypothetical protein
MVVMSNKAMGRYVVLKASRTLKRCERPYFPGESYMRLVNVLVCSLALASGTLNAIAQEAPKHDGGQPKGPGPGGKEGGPGGPGGGGGRQGGGQRREMMSPEKAKAAWEVEATGVAKRLSLSDDQTKAVVKAYTDARESQKVASEKQRKEMMEKMKEGGAGGAGEMMKAMEESNKAERTKLETALTAAKLSSDQTSKAVASLGAFNMAWDAMADTLSGFNLEGAKKQDALNAVEDFVVAGSKARTASPEDREAQRTAMNDARTKLMDAMKKQLTDDQMKKFEGSVRGPGGRGGPGGGRGEGRGEGQGGPGGPVGPGDK